MSGQLKFKIRTWGGKRRGAGRPNRSQSVNHMARAPVDFRKPLHITIKLRKGLPSLRSKRLYQAFLQSVKGARHYEMHVLHFSILRNHIHMLVEAPDNQALANGMRSFGGRFGKLVKRYAVARAKNGSVFWGRYHLTVIQSPRQMRQALEYVLLNVSKHRKLKAHLDPFSSGQFFLGWRVLLRTGMNSIIENQIRKHRQLNADDLGLAPPRSWLAREGWRRASA